MQSLVSEIKIVPIGDVDHRLIEYLSLTLPGILGSPCVTLRADISHQDCFDSTRRQYHSTRLLAKLREVSIAVGGRILGVTELDLFIPIFTFVFGEAQVRGSAALMSTHRLHQRFYGLPENTERLFARAEKEATHELGHAFGLAHCRNLDCVMRFSNSVEEVDLKASDFCRMCEARLLAHAGSSVAA